MGARLTWNPKVVCSIHTGFILFSFCFMFKAFQTQIPDDPCPLVLLFFQHTVSFTGKYTHSPPILGNLKGEVAFNCFLRLVLIIFAVVFVV